MATSFLTPVILLATFFLATPIHSLKFVLDLFGLTESSSVDPLSISPTSSPTFAPNVTNSSENYDNILDLKYQLPPISPHLVNHSFDNPAKVFSVMAGGFVNLIMAPFEEIEQLAVDVLVNRRRWFRKILVSKAIEKMFTKIAYASA